MSFKKESNPAWEKHQEKREAQGHPYQAEPEGARAARGALAALLLIILALLAGVWLTIRLAGSTGIGVALFAIVFIGCGSQVTLGIGELKANSPNKIKAVGYFIASVAYACTATVALSAGLPRAIAEFVN